MNSRRLLRLRQIGRKLSVRAGAFAVLAIVAALVAKLLSPYVPEEFSDLIGGDAVDNILRVMANSMLLVTTFALSTMVAAFSSATQKSIPRSTTWIIDDAKSHNAISIFLGAFIYSVVALIAMSAEYYSSEGKAILMGITSLVLAAVIWVIIRWVEVLKNMGLVSETIKHLEGFTIEALRERTKHPAFGCTPLRELPDRSVTLTADGVGHLQHIDLEELSRIAEKLGANFYVTTDVGDFVYQGRPLLEISPEQEVAEGTRQKIRDCFTLGSNRTFEGDPYYCLTVLSGIGQHALSPSVNDPGTAIDVIGSLVRVLSFWASASTTCRAEDDARFHRLHLRTLETHALFEAAFYNIAFEGANQIQVVRALQEGLNALALFDAPGFRQQAQLHADIVQRRATDAFSFKEDISRKDDAYARFDPRAQH
jgi:uncharacterized membrane protein